MNPPDEPSGRAFVIPPGGAEPIPNRAYFAELATLHSPDLATLRLIDLLARRPENARLARLFEAHLAWVRATRWEESERLAACLEAVDPPPIWFVPGWFYETQPGTGADFARQRRLLDRLGVANRLVPTIENGTVEANAAIVAAELRALGRGERVILVSASKGGPEVAHALGRLLEPEATRPVRAWINIGGLLRGTPLADFATGWPIRWAAPLYFHFRGLDPGASLPSLTTDESRARFARERIPARVMLINFAGIPLSGHVSAAAEFGYGRMRAQGPNDGLTLIADELAHGGRTIVQIGLDHYYRDPELDLKTVALTLTVMSELDGVPSGICTPGAGAALTDRG